MTDHVSDLQWDRMLAGELGLDTFSSAHAHARSCPGCASRLRELIAERDAFALHRYRFPPRRARRRAWLLLSLGPVATAAVVLIALWPRSVEHHDGVVAPAGPMSNDSIDIRTKGSAARLSVQWSDRVGELLLLAGRPGALAPVGDGDVIHPGDYLQAGYSAARDGFGAVLSRDGAGSVTAYVPPNGDAMVSLPAGAERSFPHSTIVDGVLGSERIAIVWCPTSHRLEPLLGALRLDGAIPVPADCIARMVTLEKRPAPVDGVVNTIEPKPQ